MKNSEIARFARGGFCYAQKQEVKGEIEHGYKTVFKTGSTGYTLEAR